MRLLVVTLLAGCTLSEPVAPGHATVQLSDPHGIRLDGWPVLFHGSDGEPLALLHTDAHGVVIGPMESGGMVTYPDPTPGRTLVTRGGIQLGDTVIDGGVPARFPSPTETLIVGTPGAPSEARLVRVHVVCGDRLIEKTTTPGTDVPVEVPTSCLRADSRTLFAFVTATDEILEPVAYDLFTVELGTRTAVPQWRTDFTDAPATIIGLGADLVSYQVEAEAFLGDASIVRIALEGEGPVTTLTPSLRLPAGVPGASHYRFAARYPDGEQLVEQLLFPDTPFVLGPTDLPPRLTRILLDGDVLTFTTDRRIDDDVMLDAVLRTSDSSAWRVHLPGPIAHLPDVGELASFTRNELTLHQLAVRYDHDDVTFTTAMPFAPR